jgi:hypothetical protein
VLSTLLFVVAGFGNGPNRAAVNAFAASTRREEEAVGPMVGVGKPLRPDDGPIGHEDRSDGCMASLFELFHDVATQCRVEFLTENPDSGPFLGWFTYVFEGA